MTHRRETVPTWVLLGALITLAANVLASAMTGVTVGLMRSMSEFAEAVRAHDLLCKERGCSVLVSEATFALATARGSTQPLAPLETVVLRGRQTALRVFGA